MAPPQSGSPRITVINDSPEFLELMQVLLEEESGYDVSILEVDQITSLEPVRATRPDLIIVDLRLVHGRLSGFEVLSQIRGEPELREVAILVCTADQEELRKREAQLGELPRLAALLKPFTVGELERKVRSLVG